jgi:hypothetical protein
MEDTKIPNKKIIFAPAPVFGLMAFYYLYELAGGFWNVHGNVILFAFLLLVCAACAVIYELIFVPISIKKIIKNRALRTKFNYFSLFIGGSYILFSAVILWLAIYGS